MLHSSPCRITTQEQTLQVLQSYQVIKSSMHLALRKCTGGERKTVIKTMQHNYQTWSIWQKTSKTSLFPFIPRVKKKKNLSSHFSYSTHPFLQCSFQPLCIWQHLYIQYIFEHKHDRTLWQAAVQWKKPDWKGIQEICSFLFFKRNYP